MFDVSEEGSNCTFMELKLEKSWQGEDQEIVLIVPLWNWNYNMRYKANSCHEF